LHLPRAFSSLDMRQDGSTFVLSATDLSNFLSCRHRTALEMEAAAGLRQKPTFDDPLLELLFKRGADHEKEYVDTLRAQGRMVVDLTDHVRRDAHLAATLDAMREGVDVIVQGALSYAQWFGKPDLLLRTATPSTLGDWSYEIADTKLARETRAGMLLQLGLYSRMLAEAQGLVPERIQVVTPDPEHPIHVFRLNEYAAYARLIESQLAATVARPATDVAAAYYPEPVDHCRICPWSGQCREKRTADDHLSLVAGISRTQRRELETRGATTLTDLAHLPLPIPFKPDRGSAESYVRVREQARLQFESRGVTPPHFELREIKAGEGLCRLPEPSPGDLFLDLEGDNLAVEGGREYLFGVVGRSADGAAEYQGLWAADAHEERAAFEAVIDRIVLAAAAHPEMHVYHYAPYEATAFRRLMGRYATRENEVDGLLRAGRLVDLYAVVRQGLRAGIERYSIKNLEVLYGFTRDVPLPEAGPALRDFEYALATNGLGALPQEVRDTVEGYNRDDCVSTLRLYEWLETVRADAVHAGAEIPRPVLESAEPSEQVSARQQRTDALRTRLLNGAEGRPLSDSPELARWLLAYLLDFHRREEKQAWARYFELCAATDEDLLDAPEAVAGLTHHGRIDVVRDRRTRKPTGSVVDRYAFPPQEMEIRRNDKLKTREKSTFGDVVSVDRVARTIDVRKGKKVADVHPEAVFEHSHVPSAPLEDALVFVGESVAARPALDGANSVARALLLREPPRLTSGDLTQAPVDVVHRLDHTVLAIQGPPGSGKTYTGARMICALVSRGKRVGVTGPSHKAIANLLEECVEAAAETGQPLRVAQKGPDDDDEDLPSSIAKISNNDEAQRLLADRDVDVVGGTAWLWARPDMAGAVDVLFVDEAGQVSLANAIAVSAAAESMVLLGDPQQLDQPQKGSHPEGVEASALQHVLGEHETIPNDRGIFLPHTWRLSPAICAFTSELFYEGRLTSTPGLEHQALVGVAGLSGSGLWCVDVDHDGRTSSSDEEVEVVAALVERLTAAGASWISKARTTTRLTLDDILVVSPFNAQVSRLIDRLPAGARVGTVDKFQGQAAPVVIYSMATSRPEDAPRGMEFLYSLNRLNVATSRAKCAAIVVASPRLYEPECRSPRQMKLANALCRYRELARRLEPLGVPV
jgi:predicted RecB family nuclease